MGLPNQQSPLGANRWEKHSCPSLCLRMTNTLSIYFGPSSRISGLSWPRPPPQPGSPGRRLALGGAAEASPLSAASPHLPRGPGSCPTASALLGAGLSPLLTLLQSRETLNKAICVCQRRSAHECQRGRGPLKGSQWSCIRIRMVLEYLPCPQKEGGRAPSLRESGSIQ